jgi:spermidine/putrescine transport system permease protein
MILRDRHQDIGMIIEIGSVGMFRSLEQRRNIMLRLLVTPAALWMVLFFAVPLIIVVGYSVLTPSSIYQVTPPLTPDHYLRLAEPTYTSVLVRSILTAVVTTVICLLVGYPLAFFIATRAKSVRNFFLLLVIIPFWTNFLVRTYAISFLINDTGLVNTLLTDYLHLINEPIHMMNTPFAVYLGLVYGYLPFMVLPIYTAIEKFNFRLVEAAYDLGANDWRAFWRVIVPVTLPGVLAGAMLVFIPAFGSYVTPDLLGGARFLMVGNQIKQFVDSPTGKPFGSALSIAMMLVVVVALLIFYRFGDRESLPV